jgi:putative salt-induced outer membrane protein YdiY
MPRPAPRHHALLLLTLLLCSATTATAQSGREFTAALGFVNTTGNAQLTSVSAEQALKFSRGPWALHQTFGTVYGENAGTVNTSLWRAGLRGDRSVGRVASLFVLTAWDRNTFAGIDSRLEEALGVGLKAIDTERRTLSFELGGGAVQQWNTEGTRYETFPSARASTAFRQHFASAAYVQQSVEVLPNLRETRDLRINTETALVAPISANIGLKMSYVIRYDGLPQPGFKTTDGILTTGLQITY